jgi:hypothetical protein
MKTKKATKSESVRLAQPRDPDICFVLFPSAHLTAASAAVSLNSLLLQLQKQPGDRRIAVIHYDQATRRMEIRFEPESAGGA